MAWEKRQRKYKGQSGVHSRSRGIQVFATYNLSFLRSRYLEFSFTSYRQICVINICATCQVTYSHFLSLTLKVIHFLVVISFSGLMAMVCFVFSYAQILIEWSLERLNSFTQRVCSTHVHQLGCSIYMLGWSICIYNTRNSDPYTYRTFVLAWKTK